ncbi:MAG: hypothetical protein IJN45_08940 [Alistipes sp.]|nr:hypothetical protein [Alistipes sp.]MBQ6989254.1 hypothetical protein [Alistipes sp.]
MITLHYDDKTLEVQESESSYRYRALMAKPQLVLRLNLAEYVEFPVGTWCEFMGQRFYLPSLQNIKKHGTRNLELTLTMGSDEERLADYKLRNMQDFRLKFSMCAKPHEYLELIVANLNARDGAGVWSVGDCIEATEKTVEFNHTFVDAALVDVANIFETEFEIKDRAVSLHKVEYFKDSPLVLSYGKGNGFVPGVGRSTLSSHKPIKRLFVQGGEENIDRSKYGSPTLLLPKGQTLEYEGRTYRSDENGFSIERIDKVSSAVKEDSLDCSEISPKREGTVSSVKVVNEAKNFYDFIDESIPENLNFNDYIIEGETPIIRFQTGMLSGEKEFEFKYIHDERRFELVPQEIDGVVMPGGAYAPAVGDTYAVFGISLPDEYVCDNESQTGASWDMFREAAKHLYENEDQKFTFSGELQGLWAKRNWENVGGKLVVGGYVQFTDEQFAPDGVNIRIVGVKEYLSNPYAPTIEISNEAQGADINSSLRDIENKEIEIDDKTKSVIRFTKRRFRDAKETMQMLEDALLNFSDSINPVAVQTMAMLVGDESLQFRFVKSKTNLTQVAHNIEYDSATKQLHCPAGFLQHMTLGITSLSSAHKTDEYKVWKMKEFLSGTLTDGSKKYYLYARVSSTSTDAEGDFVLMEWAVDMNEISGYYYLLVGVLNSELEGERSYVDLYGFTEVLPGRITTDRIVSASGDSYFDMLNNAMKLGDVLDFNSKKDGKLRLKGTIVQNQDGTESVIGCFRGEYNASYTYYNGDEVTYNDGKFTSTYRCVAAASVKGIAPTNTNYWQIMAQGSKGDKGDTGDSGEDGKAGDYYEYRYAVNGSITSAPTLSNTSRTPSGWSTTVPAVGTLQYLWFTVAKISGADNTLLSNWSTPQRLTPKDGEKGDKGDDGKSPALVFRGEYKSDVTYYGNQYRVDCVKGSDGAYYVARIDAGEFKNVAPPGTSKWNSFGAVFESVATNLLLAENANIAGWVFRNGRMESQTTDSSGNPMAYLDGTKGEVRLKGTIQHSTGTKGNFSDVDLFSLPKRTTVMSDSVISMGSEKEDIGKRCLLTNTSELGSMGYYRIRSSTFGWNGNTTYIGSAEIYLLAPGETIEMTCFELPSGSTVNISGSIYTVEGGGYWKVTNRYHKELAPIVAMGKVTNSTSGASITGNSIAGTDFSVSRSGVGEKDGLYTVTLPEFFKYASNLLVMLTGIGYVQGSTVSPTKATLISQNGRTLTIMVSDDETANGGSFAFVIYSYGGYSI